MATLPTHAGSQRWLPGLSFFLADVRDGLGPFLGVFLVGQRWQADDIGYVMTIGGIAGMLATTPLGALVDASRSKRRLLAAGILLLIAGNLALWLAPTFAVTAISQVATGVVGALVAPAVMGITLGIVGHDRLPRQLGLNEAWNHAGNLVAAALAGWMGYRWGLPAVFALMALMGGATLVCLWRIRPEHIDHDMARGQPAGQPPTARGPGAAPSVLRVLLRTPALRLLAVTMLLFHFGNAAMLPLLGQAAASRGQVDASVFTALTIIVAQLVMIPVALASGRYASRHGYWALVMVAMLVLPVRGLVAGCWSSPWALIPVQVLDGIGAGLLGVALPGLVAQVLRGSGHLNAGLGAVMTVQGLGAAMSPAFAGLVAHHFGYDAAFIALSAIATIGLVTCRLGMSGQKRTQGLEPAA